MSQQQIAAQRSLKRRNQFRRNLPLYLMLLLPVLLLFIYNYIPMAGIVIAFQKFLPAKGVLGSKWVGLQNFKTLFGRLRSRPAQHPDPVCVEDRAGRGGARGLYAAAQ